MNDSNWHAGSLLNHLCIMPTDTAERLRWNTIFEDALVRAYGANGLYSQNQFQRNHTLVKTAQLRIKTGEVERGIVSSSILIVDVQRLVHTDGNRSLYLYDLEAKWQGTPIEVRREIALKSIYAVCSHVAFAQDRLVCPEMTQEHLSQEFIPLLKLWTMNEASQLDRPIILHNSVIEECLRPPAGYEAEFEPYLRKQRLYRTYCILLTIANMLRLFVS